MNEKKNREEKTFNENREKDTTPFIVTKTY